ncbi:hypothetical protein GCM10007160_22290 [Litchfieldella qijiaojingensis]|uniref:AraC-type arabinose-binding/dimerisation domain-containing protein n=1 Tax=Litchfieldella qijiaojingensis TaxID=980347 RepID=A0ABQ2YTL5_9GAMM|nr:AraC family ligand binding domain-containing protein [Halomonas qijiaojingensis]GGX94222.1 hypothetical protein GCM10007160_22290 [Halomonas qijiaojingensis]
MQRNQERTHFWQASQLGGVELLHAHYVEQRFSPHVHSGYVITVIEQGGQRFRHRGSDHLAAVGSMVLINPDEVHTGSKAHEAGWSYRGCYLEAEQIRDVLNELELARGRLPTFPVSVLHDAEVARAFLRFPAWLGQSLHYVPVAVLSAIVVPGLLMPEGRLALSWDNAYLLAGLATIAIAAFSRHLLATILGGLVMFLLLRGILGQLPL